MKKALKRSLSFLLAITIIFGSAYAGLGEIDWGNFLVVKAHAASIDDLDFELNADGKSYSIGWCDSYAEGELVIPSTYNKLPVTRIMDSAFYGCETLTSIKIPSSITDIGFASFRDCTSLKSVTIPDNVERINDETFYNCTSLVSIEIPEGVITIGERAFLGCKSLVSVTIPDSVTSIGDYAFRACSNLTSIRIPDGVTMIENNIFGGCSNITSVRIPVSVSTIKSHAFFLCSALKDVYYDGNKEQWESIVIEFQNNDLLNANIHCNTNNYSVDHHTLSDGGTWFYIYNKNVLWESEFNNITSGEIYKGVKDAAVEYNGTGKTLYSNSFFVEDSNLSCDINISAKGFQKYIIPSDVAESFKYLYKFPVYLTKDRKDGETYISSVFARNNGDTAKDYLDITTEKLNLLSGIKTDVIVTAVEQGSAVKEYWLSQDEAHKICDEDADGIFSAVDLYSKFDINKPAYAYAVLENGKVTEPVSISLNKVIMSKEAAAFVNYCDSTTVSLMGKDGFKITLSDDIPLIGGANFSAGIGSIPIGIEIQNERVRISLGIDIFKNEINGEKDTTYLWQNFKDSCKSINQAVKDTADKRKTYNELKKNKFKTLDTTASKKKNFDGSFLGYVEAYIVDGEIVFKEISGTVVLEYFFNYKQQFLVAGIPAIYAYVKAGGEASVETSKGRPIADENFPFELNAKVNITPSLKIGGGVGVKDSISAGIWGKGSSPIGYNFEDNHLTLGLKGEFGLEAEFFMLKGDVTLLDGSVDVIDHYFKSSGSNKSINMVTEDLKLCYSSNTVDVFKDGEVTLADRSYLKNTSAWLGGQTTSPFLLRRAITPESVTVSDLQTSVYKNSQTQLVQFGDTMLMVWIEDCADRDSYNRMRLVYSVFNPETHKWDEPKAVADNGKADASPSLATDGKNVYVAWQNIDTTITTATNETVNTIMENTEIRIAKYNAETECFENATTITNNSSYDYAPKVTVNNGIAEVYWVNSSSLDFQKGTLSINKNDFKGTNEIVLSGLNYVHSVDSNGIDVSYTMDKDGDTSTTTDVKVYTNSVQVSVDYEDVESSCLYTTYAMLDGKKTLFYVDDYNLCYIQNGEKKVVFDSPRSVNGNVQIFSDGTKTTAMWLEAGEIGTELYTCTYEGGVWTAPVQLTSFSKILSNVATVYFDGKIYSLFNRTHLEEVTSEVDGSTYFKNGETDLCQLTTEGFTDIYLSLMEIDESQFVYGEDATFTVSATNNGTEKITDISFEITDGNGYSQTIEKEINLVSGESKFVELTYSVPETISETELSVYANVSEDVDESDNSISTKIGTPDLTIGDLRVRFIEGVYIVSGTVINKNSVSAENVKVSASLGDITDGNYIEEDIGTIEANSKQNVEFLVGNSLLDFTENSFYDATITVSTDSNERITNNNQSVTCITEAGVHLHSGNTWIVDKEATCTEDGLKSKTCIDCGEKITETIPSLGGHDYSDEWTIDKAATCIEDGSKSHHCNNCDDKIDITVITAIGHNHLLTDTLTEHPHTITYTCLHCGDVQTEIAASSTCIECNFSVTLIDSIEYKLVSYTGTESEVVIPANYEGFAVTTIANSCFKGNTAITSVEIEEGVTSVGSLAFMNCTSLEKVTIPASVVSIGTQAFYGFTGTIHCTRGSFAHEYAKENNIKYVLESTDEPKEPIQETVNTQIDYENFIIRTNAYACTDITEFLGLSDSAVAIAEASYVYGNLELYGTGTVITVFDGNDYVSDFTLVVEGDINGDSVCDVLDSSYVALVSSGKKSIDGAYKMAADSNSDDIIDISDYQDVVNKAVS